MEASQPKDYTIQDAGSLSPMHLAHTNTRLSRSPVASDISTPAVSAASTPLQSALPPAYLGPLFKIEKPRRSGVHLSTFIILVVQSALFFTTIILWILTPGSVIYYPDTSLLIHALFALATVFQIIFLERTVFLLCTERYPALHPEEVTPSTLSHSQRLDSRPTNARTVTPPRDLPPLSTYASVTGTRNVKDNTTAIPPPPAYGINHDNMLLLTGFISEDLRNEIRQMETERNERSSDASRDSEWKAMRDAIRARALDEALNRLQARS